MSSGFENQNPFQSPLMLAEAPLVQSDFDPQLVAKFRSQIHALGGVWIFFGVVLIGIFAYLVFGSAVHGTRGDSLTIFLIAVGGVWLGLGIATCLKQMWAVYIGLGLTYLSLF